MIGLFLAFLFTGCGKDESGSSTKPPDEKVFKKAESKANDAGKKGENDIVTSDEIKRQNLVKSFVAALGRVKDTDRKLDLLEKVTKSNVRSVDLVAPVVKLLADEDIDVRASAIQCRVAVSPSDAYPDIVKVLKDKDPTVRQAAVQAFAMLPDPLPFDGLFIHLAQESEWMVQQAGLTVVAKRGAAAQVGKLGDSLKNFEPRAVGPAIEFMAKFPELAKAYTDTLAWFLDRNDMSVRQSVAKLLGDWKTHSKAALSGLARCLNDEELSVRRAAFESLKTISGDDFDYRPEGSEEERKQCIVRVKEWVAANAAK